MRRAVVTVLLAACGHREVPKPAAPPAPPAAPALVKAKAGTAPLAETSIGTPVRSSRAWVNALAPNARGGWNFITQIYEYHSPDPVEWFVIDLDTGKYTVAQRQTGIYARTQIKNEILAANGRIFFPENETFMDYYDPADETLKQLGRIVDPPGDNKFIYRLELGSDGKLYGGTQSNKLPVVFQLDPETLAVKILGSVGQHRIGYSYAYYLAPDPPWLYVAVGENPWELFAVNLTTGAQTLLATRSDHAFMHFERHPEGFTASMTTGLRTAQQQKETVWLADGKMFPFQPGYDPAHLPFKPRSVEPKAGRLENPPEIDTTALTPDASGIGHVRWRPAGSPDPWHDVTFQTKYTSPVDLESLVALPDGTLLGNATQYHGFFRYDPKTGALTSYGPHGPSQGARVVMNGKVYIAGYPNGVLYELDPTKPWTSSASIDGKDGANPRKLGTFQTTQTHYAYALVPAANGRLYYAGRRERDGTGSGIGYYDPKSETFAGHDDNLGAVDPDGLAVLDAVHEVVFSGQQRDPAAGPGQLVVYDEDLHELERLVVKPDLDHTGELYAVPGTSLVLGVIRADTDPKRRTHHPNQINAIYRYDISAKRIVDWQDTGQIGPATLRTSDGSVWVVIDGMLTQIDPATFEQTVVGALPDAAPESHLAWQGDALYMTVGAELRRVTLP